MHRREKYTPVKHVRPGSYEGEFLLRRNRRETFFSKACPREQKKICPPDPKQICSLSGRVSNTYSIPEGRQRSASKAEEETPCCTAWQQAGAQVGGPKAAPRNANCTVLTPPTTPQWRNPYLCEVAEETAHASGRRVETVAMCMENEPAISRRASTREQRRAARVRLPAASWFQSGTPDPKMVGLLAEDSPRQKPRAVPPGRLYT
jgi:hypothetical protein